MVEREFGRGTRVADRYRIEGNLGRGGTSSVWHAVDETLDQEVALKRVRLGAREDTDRDAERRRVLGAARAAATVRHPNIVEIVDVIDDVEPCLVLEYVPSRSLADLLVEQRALMPRKVAMIGAQVAAALAAVHEAGGVHRDVTPGNVLIAHRELAAKLADFGVVGGASTPAYLAPEVARGAVADARADVYALGATLYAATEGGPPFGAGPGDAGALLERIGRGGAPPPRRAGPLTELLEWLLQDDPAARPTAAQAGHALQAIAAGAEASLPVAPPVATAEPLVRRSPRPSWAVPVVAALTVLAVAAATTAVIVTSRSGPLTAPPAGPGTGSPTPTAAGQVVIGDQHVADPCSLLDMAALSRHGSPELDAENSWFSECRVDLRPGVSFFVDLESGAENFSPLRGTHQTVGPLLIARSEPVDAECRRDVLLSDGNIVEVRARSYRDPPDPDLCEIAETGTAAAVTLLLGRGIAARTPLDGDRPLARLDACGLLQPADLAVVPELAAAPPRPGFAGWACKWGSGETGAAVVFLGFARRVALGPEDGEITVFHGRQAALRQYASGLCVYRVAYGPANASGRADFIEVEVRGTRPEDQRCEPATAITEAVTARLPPPA